MLIHGLTAHHQLCWDGPVTIRISRNAPTAVSNPLVALDILKNHWNAEQESDAYRAAVDACLKATQGRCSLSEARSAFVAATEHLTLLGDISEYSVDPALTEALPRAPLR